MSEVLFSICHTTARPDGWQDSYRQWLDNAACLESMEYVLCVDDRWGFTELPRQTWDPRRGEIRDCDKAVWNTGRKCLVDGANIAAANAFGKVLIINSDDMFPCWHWDTKILAAISAGLNLPGGGGELSSLDRDFVVRTHPGDKYQAWLDAFVKQGRGALVGRLVTLQILSRVRYQRFGYALYPEFTSMMADTDFTDAAEHDGVVIEARNITIEHRHPFVTGAAQDDVSKHENEMAAHAAGERIYNRRHAERSGIKLVPVHKAAEQIDGWMTQYELTWLASHAAEMKDVLEIGSWKGRSTFALLSSCNGPVYALDHWEGSRDDFRISPELGHKAYAEFQQNVGHFKNLHVIRADSTKYEPDAGFQVDMAFIDGCHAYEDVLIDIRKWRPRARRLICGHDINLPDVARAVAEEFGNAVQYGAGSIWFVWLDGTQEPDSQARTQIETLALCFPGANFDWRVHQANNLLVARLAARFELLMSARSCSNQYIVRDLSVGDIRGAATKSGRVPKYVLWRDSDNVLSDAGFDLLYDALEHAPEVSAIGGWYYMDTNPATVCAANLKDGKEEWIRFEEIQEAADKLALIELTGQIGFGAVLMRWDVIEGAGDWPFSPIIDLATGQYMGDDVSFIRRSLARGDRWFLHPEVYLPHLKVNDVAAPRIKIRSVDRDIIDMPAMSNAAD